MCHLKLFRFSGFQLFRSIRIQLMHRANGSYIFHKTSHTPSLSGVTRSQCTR